MKFSTQTSLTALSVTAAALAVPAAAQAQDLPPLPTTTPMTQAQVQSLPRSMQQAPVSPYTTQTTIGADGVETITRTRRIDSRYPQTSYQTTQPAPQAQHYAPAQYHQAHPGYVTYAPAPTAQVFQREQWIAECERRIEGYDDNDERGGIIGGLLGAITGGIIGNRIADGERLGGTLLGAGLGGLGGLIIGNLVGGGRDRDGNYDCEAALDSYLSQYGHPGSYPHGATRVIHAPTYAAPPAHYGHYRQPDYCGRCSYEVEYAPPPQIVYVPVQYQQQQQVVVRETVRYEYVPAERTVPPRRPIPIKTQPRPQPRYVKDN